ncbi:MAG: haloacid dehalogenase type II [Planctomycetota bacterium]|nr:haloacid dehalogenase type II [Planctomycetota bacterium]
MTRDHHAASVSSPLDLSTIQALTFDCYGTLIDWEAGILQAIRPVLAAHGKRVEDREILELFARLESQVQSEGYQLYRNVLMEVMERVGRHYGLSLIERELQRLPDSVARWPEFADAPEALDALARRFPLVILSNIDDELFEQTRVKLERDAFTFRRVVTAEYCRSYKPHPRHFKVGLALLDLDPSQVLHVAESVYHDLPVAKSLGMRTCWVNRRGSRGYGASRSDVPRIEPDLTTTDLAQLARLAGVE